MNTETAAVTDPFVREMLADLVSRTPADNEAIWAAQRKRRNRAATAARNAARQLATSPESIWVAGGPSSTGPYPALRGDLALEGVFFDPGEY